MRRGWKIFWIVLAILFVIIVAVIGITAYQATQIINILNDPSAKADLQALSNGDCSKLPNVEAQISNLKSTLKTGCLNPIISIFIAKNAPSNLGDICAQINSPNNQIDAGLAQINNACTAQTNQTA